MSINIHRSALVCFGAPVMFDLVNDIECYPQFVPGCRNAAMLSRSDESITARLGLTHMGITQTFTTRNRLTPYQMITLELVEGPFSQFSGAWHFHSLSDNACKISFELHGKLSNKLLAVTIGPLFKRMANTMVDAFCQRANTLYGSSNR